MKKATKKTIGRFCGLIIGMALCLYFDSDGDPSWGSIIIGGIIYLVVAAKLDGDSNGK